RRRVLDALVWPCGRQTIHRGRSRHVDQEVAHGHHTMKTIALILFCTGIVLAQTKPAAANLSASQVLDAWVANVENEVVPAAGALCEDRFDFAPVNGEFHGVRTFGAQI